MYRICSDLLSKKDENFIHRYYDETVGKKIQFHFGQLPALSVVLIAGEQSWHGAKPTECFSVDQEIIISIIKGDEHEIFRISRIHCCIDDVCLRE